FTGDKVESSPAIANGYVFIGSNDDKLYCLNTSTGECLWNYTTEDDICSSPAVAYGRVFVGSGNYNYNPSRKLYCLNAVTGALIWNYSTNGVIASSPAVAYGKVFFGSTDGNLYCLNATTGEQVWTYVTGPSSHGILSSPAIADDKVFVGSEDRKLHCVDATTGAKIWDYTFGFYVYSSPAIANGKVFVGCDDKKIYCFGVPPQPQLAVSVKLDKEQLQPGENANISIHVSCNDSPISEATITISAEAGTVEPSTGMTDAKGNFTCIYTAPSVTVVEKYTITIRASKSGYADGYASCEITVSAYPALRVSIDAFPSTIESGENATITVCVTSDSFTIAGALVNVSAEIGMIIPTSGITDSEGKFVCMYIAPVVNFTRVDTINATAAKVGYLEGLGSCKITIIPIFMPFIPWKMFRFDLSHTGFSNSAAPTISSVLWSYTVGNEIHSSAAVAEGKVFFGARNGKIYCLEKDTGIVFWEYMTSVSTWGVCSSPAVIDGKVFVGSCDKKLYCLNATTGKLVWDFSTESEIYSSPAVTHGKVFFGSCDGKLYCVNESTGNIVWSVLVGDEIYSSPAVSQGMVFIGTGSETQHTVNKIYCMDEDTGRVIWSYKCGDAVISSPSVVDGKVFFGSVDSKVYCLNATTGEHIWNYSTGAPIWSSPAIANGKVFIGSLDDVLYCLNATTGECLWNYSTGDDIYSSPCLAESKVFIGSRDGVIYCLNEDSGAVIWNYSTGFSVHGITSSPVVADGKLFVGSCDGKFYCFGKIIQPLLSVSIQVHPSAVYSNESSIVTVWVTSNNLPVFEAQVTLLVSVGSLSPATGMTDSIGKFTSTYLSPLVT
ncbi:MAG: PQQ-binding-like beta-propeller repeat protein, partial [Candidatus Thermoplasmatota archaeon]